MGLAEKALEAGCVWRGGDWFYFYSLEVVMEEKQALDFGMSHFKVGW